MKETHGVGFPLILTAWKDAGWEEPVLKNKVEIDEVELELPINIPNAPENASVKLSKTQKKILSILQANKFYKLFLAISNVFYTFVAKNKYSYNYANHW